MLRQTKVHFKTNNEFYISRFSIFYYFIKIMQLSAEFHRVAHFCMVWLTDWVTITIRSNPDFLPVFTPISMSTMFRLTTILTILILSTLSSSARERTGRPKPSEKAKAERQKVSGLNKVNILDHLLYSRICFGSKYRRRRSLREAVKIEEKKCFPHFWGEGVIFFNGFPHFSRRVKG